MKKILLFCLFLVTTSAFISGMHKTEEPLPAFPGAEGGGKYTSGGRGGKIIYVTNLQDAGPGSLRDAVKTEGPRIIVFAVSGTIELKSPLRIKKGDITIAGQTAPGDGICIRDHEFTVEADNVIIRYLRFRVGDNAGKAYDAIKGKNHKNIIIDHCSMSWSVDETASFYDNENFTLQWCIISESLDSSVHSKGAHGYGGIWGGMNASFHHNLFAHHLSRNPRFQGSRYHRIPEKEMCDFSNNVVYNWKSKCSYGGEQGHYNITGNYYKPGPATNKKARQYFLEPYSPLGWFYFEGNILENNAEVNSDNLKGLLIKQDKTDSLLSQIKFPVTPSLPVEPAEEAYRKILLYSGASLFRDATDNRIIRETETGTATCGQKGIINDPADAGGWPELRTADAPIDTDQDGMPDAWERKQQLNPDDPSDASNTHTDSQYTNIEYYINSLCNTQF